MLIIISILSRPPQEIRKWSDYHDRYKCPNKRTALCTEVQLTGLDVNRLTSEQMKSALELIYNELGYNEASDTTRRF